MTVNNVPHDVYPDSGFRLPLPKREDFAEGDQWVFDRFNAPDSPTLAGLQGPGGIRLYSPPISEYTQKLNRYLRREAGFPGRIRELAILVTARAFDNQFEWSQHEPQARKEGLPQAIIEVVRHRKAVDDLPETEAAVIRLGREMFGTRRVAPETFAAALRLFGPRQLVELVSLMGQYAATAVLLTAFDMQLRPGDKPGLPVP